VNPPFFDGGPASRDDVSLKLSRTRSLAMVLKQRRRSRLGSFLSQRIALKRPAVLKAFARNRAYRAREEEANGVFAMSYTMKVSAFLYLVIMYIIVAGRSGILYPHFM